MRKTTVKNWVWQNCYFVGKLKNITRCVLYEWKVIEDLWDKVRCEMVDQYVKADKTPFIIIFPKTKINIQK